MLQGFLSLFLQQFFENIGRLIYLRYYTRRKKTDRQIEPIPRKSLGSILQLKNRLLLMLLKFLTLKERQSNHICLVYRGFSLDARDELLVLSMLNSWDENWRVKLEADRKTCSRCYKSCYDVDLRHRQRRKAYGALRSIRA